MVESIVPVLTDFPPAARKAVVPEYLDMSIIFVVKPGTLALFPHGYLGPKQKVCPYGVKGEERSQRRFRRNDLLDMDLNVMSGDLSAKNEAISLAASTKYPGRSALTRCRISGFDDGPETA
jgi:hypothetical protein